MEWSGPFPLSLKNLSRSGSPSQSSTSGMPSTPSMTHASRIHAMRCHQGIKHSSFLLQEGKTVVKVDKLASSDAVVPFKINGECRKIYPGRPSALDPFEGDLMRSIFEMREQGLPVNTRTLRKEAARLSQVFKDNSIKAKISSVTRFVKKTGLSHRVSTHVAQKDHKETEEESAHFMNLMRQKVLGMDPDDIINMDQTQYPTPFSPIALLIRRNQRHSMFERLQAIRSVRHLQQL